MTARDGRAGRVRGGVNAVLVLLLLFGVVIASPAGAHVSDSTYHLWAEHIRPRLAKDGTINDPNNPVTWTRLKGVPFDIADGEDRNTLTSAGYGFDMRHFFGIDALDADWDVLQRRLPNGFCQVNRAIRIIREDGTMFCGSMTNVYTANVSNTGSICNTNANVCTEGSIALPAGTFSVVAKLTVKNDVDGEVQVTCGLYAPGDELIDKASVAVDAETTGDEEAATTMVFNSIATLGSAGSVSVKCFEPRDGQSAYGRDLSILAELVTQVTRP